MSLLQGFTLSAEAADAYLKSLEATAFDFAYLELVHRLHFATWDPADLAHEDVGALVQGGRLFGPAGELSLRRLASGSIRFVWLSDGPPLPGSAGVPIDTCEEVLVGGEPELVWLWGERSGGHHFDLRVGAHAWPLAADRIVLSVRPYLDESGEPKAWRWLEVQPAH